MCCRTESKVWSPLVNEEGKTHPYKMNLASQPQVSKSICMFPFPLTPGWLWSSFWPDPPRSQACVTPLVTPGTACAPYLPWKPAETDRQTWSELVGYLAAGKLLGLEVVSPAMCMLTPVTGRTEGTVEVWLNKSSLPLQSLLIFIDKKGLKRRVK